MKTLTFKKLLLINADTSNSPLLIMNMLVISSPDLKTFSPFENTFFETLTSNLLN